MQGLIVALIVACSAFAVARRYLPAVARSAIRSLGAQTAGKIGWRGLAEKLQAPAPSAQECGSGCGSCGNCASPAAQGDTRQIPIRKI